MNHNAPPIPTQLVVSATVALAGIIAYVAALLIEEEQREVQESLLAQSLALLRESRKRRARAVGDGPRKKSYIMWNRDRARECIMEDYLGNVPRFNDAGFKRMFHVSRQKYDELRSIYVIQIHSSEIPLMLETGAPYPLMLKF